MSEHGKNAGTLLEAASSRAPRPSERNSRTVVVPNYTLARLAPYAAIRDISVNELCRRLLETAEDEGLIDAILDDVEGDAE